MAAGSHISGTAGTPLSRMAWQLSIRHTPRVLEACATHAGHKTLSYPAADKNAHTSSKSACSQAHTVTCPSHARKSGGHAPGIICLHPEQRKRIARPIRLQKGGEPHAVRAPLAKGKEPGNLPLINQANHWQSFAQARAQDPQCRINPLLRSRRRGNADSGTARIP